jgi:hypothetical protein
MSYVTGSWVQMDGDVYVRVNKHGTLEKIEKPKWWRIFFLAIFQAVGKKNSLEEIREYLKPPRSVKK